MDELATKAHEEVIDQGFEPERIRCEYYLHLRFERTDCAIMVKADYSPKDRKTLSAFEENFREAYKREFGFVLENRDIIVDDVR